jgi:hypothetical protein
MAGEASIVTGGELEHGPLDLHHPDLDRWCKAQNADQAAVLAESGWVPAPDLVAPSDDETPGDEPAEQEA